MKVNDIIFSSDGKKTAKLIEVDGCFAIEMTENGVLLETRSFPDKSIYYAEDAAYNFIDGILKPRVA